MDSDWGEVGKVISYIIPAILFVLFNVMFKKKREQQRRLEVVKNLISEIDYNSRVAESLALRSQIKKFKTAAWKRNKEKIEYIDEKLQSILANAYDIADELNRHIDKAKEFKSTSYMIGIDTNRLIEPLIKSKQGLEDWMELNKSNKKLTISR
jgi:hypothetical protein